LALYEPTLFGLLDAQSPPPNDADGIRETAASAAAAVEAGDLNLAAERFIDFWMGKGTWAHTFFNEPTPLAAFSELNVPVLYMMGSQSPASSRGVGRLLIRTLPNVQAVEFEGIGHMGPVTHPDVVNAAISRFLEHSSGSSRSAEVAALVA
jgi:pimeloyl-ACP methyl ester carboxylesterase